jgi:hypothetical protein
VGVDGRPPDDLARREAYGRADATVAAAGRPAQVLVPAERRTADARRTQRRHCRAVLVGAVCYTVAVTVLGTWRGPGVSPDSVAYASAANALVESGTLTMFDGGYLRFFPPGLPLTLAGLSWLGVPLGVGVTMLNCIAASGTVVATERIAVRATGSPVLAAGCAVALAVSMGFVSVNAMLWTEPIVGLATAVWILLLQRLYANAALTRADGAALAVVITVAYTFRYAAIFMLAVTALSVAIVYWRAGRVHALASAGRLAAAASIGLAGIAVENARHGVGPLGQRAPSTQDGVDVGWQAVTGLGELLLNVGTAPLWLARAAGLAVVGALVSLLVRGIRSRRSQRWSATRLDSPLTPLIVAATAYWAFLVASELTTAINPIGYRLLYPILPVMVVLGIVGVRTLMAESRRQLVRRLWHLRFHLFASYVTVLACAGIGWSCYAAGHGLQYNQVGLRDDAWIPVVRRLPSDAGLISNDPYRVHWLTQRSPVHPSFGLAFYADGDPDERARMLCSLVYDAPNTYLLWLGDGATKGVRDFATLGFGTTPVSTGDGYSLFDVDGCYRLDR